LKKRVKWIITIAFAVVVLVWMVFSTSWFASIQNRDVEIISAPAISQEVMGVAFVDDDVMKKSFSTTDMMFETMRVTGFVYNLSYATDEEATRSVVFSSPERSYRIPVEKEFRINAARKWYEGHVTDQTPKMNTKFDFNFSPLAFKDGTYNILLQVEEHGEPVARAATGYVIEKVNGHATVLYKPSKPVEAIGETVKGATANFRKARDTNNNMINLQGWAVINSIDSTQDTEVYLEVYNGNDLVGTYSTTKECILYIADYFGTTGYYTAGFLASIPGTLTDDLVVRVYVEHDGVYYGSDYHFVLGENAEGQTLVSAQDTE